MGESFSEFLLNRRIELAKEVLRDLTLNITEVARKVGYDDPGYFARRFRRKTGMSPREWRETLTPL
jgi:two-component system response regulator YesN